MSVFTFFVCLTVCFAQLNGDGTITAPDVYRLNFFDTDLLRYTAEEKKGNVMVSPASIKAVLAMLLEAANGKTANEIRSAMRLSQDKNEFRETLNLYLSALNANTSASTLQSANAVFLSQTINLKRNYEVMLRKVYYSDIRRIDVNDPINASDTINKWVIENTKGLIPSIVEPANIIPSTDIIIANAMYFKGSWRHAFNAKWTHGACFRVEGSCRKVEMMELHEELKYAFVDNLRAHALELPYEGGRYSMLLLVPYEADGWVPLIRDLPYMSIPQISRLLEPAEVRLFLPKFSVDYSESMVEPLRSMKITTLFTKNANLSGMYEGEGAQVNNILHKVHMTVDEIGTVAAAASSAMVIPLIEDGVLLRVDRPFLFFIKDDYSGIILFEGKIGEPTEYVEKETPNDALRRMPPRRHSWIY